MLARCLDHSLLVVLLAGNSWQAAEADPLREHAAQLVEYQNKERTEDVLRIASFALGVPLVELEGAQLLWIDRLGIYLFAATVGGAGAQVKRPLCCQASRRRFRQQSRMLTCTPFGAGRISCSGD